MFNSPSDLLDRYSPLLRRLHLMVDLRKRHAFDFLASLPDLDLYGPQSRQQNFGEDLQMALGDDWELHDLEHVSAEEPGPLTRQRLPHARLARRVRLAQTALSRRGRPGAQLRRVGGAVRRTQAEESGEHGRIPRKRRRWGQWRLRRHEGRANRRRGYGPADKGNYRARKLAAETVPKAVSALRERAWLTKDTRRRAMASTKRSPRNCGSK